MRILMAVLLLLAFAAVSVFASVTFAPPDAKEVKLGTLMLKPEKAAGKATGTVSLVCSADMAKGILTIQAKNLDPKKVYTVWLVSMPKPAMGKMSKADMEKMAKPGMGEMKMMGVGKAPYLLPANSKGYANLAAPVMDCKAVAMQMLEIVDHPSKDPKDMKKMVPIFKANLMEMMQGEKVGAKMKM